MINTIILGHALNVLPKLPAESVNCVTCSPPYWSLRDYGIEPVIWDGVEGCEHEWITHERWLHRGTTKLKQWDDSRGHINDQKAITNFCLKCNAWRGSLGLEPTFELYIKHLCDIFEEIKRVLRKDGTCWVNIGDSYNSHTFGKSKLGGGLQKNLVQKNEAFPRYRKPPKNLGDKSLCLIPQRFAIEMVNRGWILRNTVIWHKPNCMPSSAKDRFTVDFEYVYFFVKSKKYWFEQAFEAWTDTNPNDTKRAGKYIQYGGKWKDDQSNRSIVVGNPEQGRNKRCVWKIPTKSFKEAHFATFPETLIEPMIQAGCPEFICKKCGKARVKILEPTEGYKKHLGGKGFGNKDWLKTGGGNSKSKNYPSLTADYKFKGYSDCGCNAGWESGIVLDPFMGAGTSALVALKQRKRFIGIEIKQEYIDMSYKRIAKVQQRIF